MPFYFRVNQHRVLWLVENLLRNVSTDSRLSWCEQPNRASAVQFAEGVIDHENQRVCISLKVGFRYPSSWPEFTGRVDVGTGVAFPSRVMTGVDQQLSAYTAVGLRKHRPVMQQPKVLLMINEWHNIIWCYFAINQANTYIIDCSVFIELIPNVRWNFDAEAVSYTHLTLPTIYSV